MSTGMAVLRYFYTDCIGHWCYSLVAAPPLMLENVLPVLKGVKNWRTLANKLLRTYDQCSDRLLQYLRDATDLDVFQHQHGSDENCLKAVLEKFLLGKGLYKQPSWRAVIWSLYMANEIHLAHQIESYAEPVQSVCSYMYMYKEWARFARSLLEHVLKFEWYGYTLCVHWTFVLHACISHAL